jgi:hypothetical protein
VSTRLGRSKLTARCDEESDSSLHGEQYICNQANSFTGDGLLAPLALEGAEEQLDVRKDIAKLIKCVQSSFSHVRSSLDRLEDDLYSAEYRRNDGNVWHESDHQSQGLRGVVSCPSPDLSGLAPESSLFGVLVASGFELVVNSFPALFNADVVFLLAVLGRAYAWHLGELIHCLWEDHAPI